MGRNPRSDGVSAALVASLCLTSCATVPAVAPTPPPPVYQPPPTTADADQLVLVGTVIQVTDGDTIKMQFGSGPISVRFDSSGAPGKNRPARLEAPFCQEDYRAA